MLGVPLISTRWEIDRQTPDRDPKDWQLFGSDDGQKWSMLDTRENEKFPIRFFPRSYSVRNTTARYYRLHVSANHGNATGL